MSFKSQWAEKKIHLIGDYTMTNIKKLSLSIIVDFLITDMGFMTSLVSPFFVSFNAGALWSQWKPILLRYRDNFFYSNNESLHVERVPK